jgi:hypothetical protein
VATRTVAARPRDGSKLSIDATVQPVMFPTDALLHWTRERLVRLAREKGVVYCVRPMCGSASMR